MNIPFEDRIARIWSDEIGPIVFSVVNGMPTSHTGFVEFCDQEIDLIKKINRNFRVAYSIMDLSACQPVPLNIAIDYADKGIERQLRAGLRFKALIRPVNPVSYSVLLAAFKNVNSSKVKWYDSFEDAMRDINQRMTDWEVSKRNSFSKALFGLSAFLNL